MRAPLHGKSLSALRASSILLGALTAVIAFGCGPDPKTPEDLENDNTAARVLRLVPARADVVVAVREVGHARDLAQTLWDVGRGFPGAGKVIPEVERGFAREFPDISLSPEGLAATGLDLAGDAALFVVFEPRSPKGRKRETAAFLLPVLDREKLLATFERLQNAEIERSSDEKKRLLTRVDHPAGRGIVSFTAYRWSEFRWDIAFREGYALFVKTRGEWVDGKDMPPKPNGLVVEWLDLTTEGSLWVQRFGSEFRDARDPHDGLLFVSLTGELGAELWRELKGPKPLLADLSETRGFVVTGLAGDGGTFTLHGQAPNPMVGKLVHYFRAAPGGGDPLALGGGEGRDAYRLALNPELVEIVADRDLKYMEDDLRIVGVDLRADLLDNFTGAACMYSGPGYDDLTLAFGVRDLKRTAKLLTKAAGAMGMVAGGMAGIDIATTIKSEERGEVTVHDVAMKGKGDLEPLHLFMTAANGLLVITTESEMVDRAIAGGAARAPDLGDNPIGARIFGTDYFASGYMRAVDPAKAVRGLALRLGMDAAWTEKIIHMPGLDLREFPKGLREAMGPAATAVDSLRYALDRVYDVAGGYGLRGDGFVLDVTLRTL